MKRLLFAAVLALATFPVFASDVGVSVSIGQPGFYGRLDIGGYPPPQLIYRQPVIIEHVTVRRPPVYLYVPPGHAKNWRKHCRAYNACGERVYFVQDRWYSREYVPRYRQRHGDRRDDRWDERRGDHRGDNRHDRRDFYEPRERNNGHR